MVILSVRMLGLQGVDVFSKVHRALGDWAARAGQSLQDYLLAPLVADAKQPTLDETLAKVAERSGGQAPLADAAKTVRSERNGR